MKLLFLGDMLYDYSEKMPDIDGLSRFIRDGGYEVILNLEGAAGEGGMPIEKRGPNHRHNMAVYDVLPLLHTRAVCLANNHAMDFGGEALADGLRRLDQAGIAHVGAGMKLSQAAKPLTLDCGGRKVILCNAGWDVEETVYAGENTPGCAPLDRKAMVEHVGNLRREDPGAVIVCCLHWGFEFNTLPMPLDIQFAHDLVDAGCDLIIGSHPHVLQSRECYKGKEIFYSLGNFYFGSRRKNLRREFTGCAVKNMCDYGAAVALDTETGEIRVFGVDYDLQTDTSRFCEDSILELLPAMDWRSETYRQEVLRRSCNGNPVLGTDENENARRLRKLYFKYAVSEKIRFLKKSPIGAKFYDFLKSRTR